MLDDQEGLRNVHTHRDTHMDRWMYTHTYAYTDTYTYIIHVYVYVYIHMPACMYVYSSVSLVWKMSYPDGFLGNHHAGRSTGLSTFECDGRLLLRLGVSRLPASDTPGRSLSTSPGHVQMCTARNAPRVFETET